VRSLLQAYEGKPAPRLPSSRHQRGYACAATGSHLVTRSARSISFSFLIRQLSLPRPALRPSPPPAGKVPCRAHRSHRHPISEPSSLQSGCLVDIRAFSCNFPPVSRLLGSSSRRNAQPHEGFFFCDCPSASPPVAAIACRKIRYQVTLVC